MDTDVASSFTSSAIAAPARAQAQDGAESTIEIDMNGAYILFNII